MLCLADETGALIPVLQSEESCGVRLVTDKNQSLVFLSRYDSCYAQTEVKQQNCTKNFGSLWKIKVLHTSWKNDYTKQEDIISMGIDKNDK